MGPPFAHNLHPSVGEEMLPDAGSAFLNHAPDHLVPPHELPPTESMETDTVDRVQASKSSNKKSKSRRTKRKKHKQSRTNIDNRAGGEDLQISSEGLSHMRHEDRSTPVDQSNPHAQHASTNGVISDNQLEGEVRVQAPRQKVVHRVKEEPVSDTEETCHRAPTTKVRYNIILYPIDHNRVPYRP